MYVRLPFASVCYKAKQCRQEYFPAGTAPIIDQKSPLSGSFLVEHSATAVAAAMADAPVMTICI